MAIKINSFTLLIISILIFFITTNSFASTTPDSTDEFSTISLDMAYTLAIKNSADISLRNLSVAIQKKEHSLDIRSFLPQVSLAINTNNSIRHNAADSYEKSVALNISQPIFQSGKLIYKRKITKARISIEKQNTTQAIYTLMRKVWEQYFDILQSKQTLEFRNKTFDNLKKQVIIVTEQRAQGRITNIAYLETLTKVKTEEIALKKLANELRLKKIAFSRLIKIPSNHAQTFTLLTPNTTYEPITISDDMIPQLLMLAKNTNLDLKKKHISLEEIKFNLLQNKLQFLPSVSLDFSSNVSGATFPLSSYNYSFGITLQFANWGSPISTKDSFSSSDPTEYNTSGSKNINILKDMKSFTKVASLKLQKKQIEEEIIQLNDTIKDNLQQQILSLTFQQEQYTLQKELVDIEEKKKIIITTQATQGIVTSLKLVDYLIEYQKKKTALINSKFSLSKALKTLEFTLGLYQSTIRDIL